MPPFCGDDEADPDTEGSGRPLEDAETDAASVAVIVPVLDKEIVRDPDTVNP